MVLLTVSKRPAGSYMLSWKAHQQQQQVMRAMPQYPAILIKRYARSRLYDTVAARYLTVDDLRRREDAGVAFVVLDAETGDDITRVLLA